MKTIFRKNRSQVALTVLMLAASMAVGRADVVFYQNTFDDSSSVSVPPATRTYNPPPIYAVFDFGSAAPTAVHSTAWATNDAAGSLSSGSLQFNWNWNFTADGAGAAAFTIDLFAAQITNASDLSFDIMVDPSSTPDPFGGNGYFQVVTRDGNYSFDVTPLAIELGNPTYGSPNQGTWQHIDIPLTGANANVRAMLIQDYNSPDRAIVGSETIYIDNLTISVPGVLVPPTNTISVAGTKGLYMFTTVNSSPDSPQYQRQGIRTATSEYSWLGSGANPVTYSLTIASFPPSAHSNFEAYIFLVPTNSFTGGPTEPNPDWVEPTLASFNIQNNADGTATAQFQYKVEAANANESFVANVSSPSVLGTWSLTFTNNDNIILTAPGGATTITNFPNGPGTGASFGSQVGVYIGTRPNDTNNTGQQNIFSHFQIVSNNVTLLNEDFSTPTLSSTWAMAAEDQTGILQVPPSTAYVLTWTLPDSGFSLQANTNLSNPDGWHSPGLAKSTYNSKATVLIPSTMVATNSPAFFRLIKP